MPRIAALLLCALAALVASATPAPEPTPWVTGWDKPVDPKGDCKFERKGDRLTIFVPGKDHEFNYGPTRRSLNGPRLLRDVEGDFVVEVLVSGDNWEPGSKRSRGAGLVVMDEKEPIGTLEFQGRPHPDEHEKQGWEIRSEIYPDGSVTTSFDYGPIIPPLGYASLRLERRGDKWRASFRKDHKEWKELPTLTLNRNVPRKLKVGVFAEANVEGEFKVVFDHFKLSRPTK